jgi:hypothetical protein
MPRLDELQSLYEQHEQLPSGELELEVEETLVPDRRLGRSTSQVLEEKLLRLARSRRRDESRQLSCLDGSIGKR